MYLAVSYRAVLSRTVYFAVHVDLIVESVDQCQSVSIQLKHVEQNFQ